MDKVLTAIERTALPKQMLYSDFVGGSMIGIHFGVGIYYSPTASPCLLSGERAVPVKKKKGAFVRKRVKASFDPKVFLAKVGEGKTISNIERIKLFFRKDRSRTLFFTSSKARSSSRSFPSKARKRWLQSWDPGIFSVKDV